MILSIDSELSSSVTERESQILSSAQSGSVDLFQDPKTLPLQEEVSETSAVLPVFEVQKFLLAVVQREDVSVREASDSKSSDIGL